MNSTSDSCSELSREGETPLADDEDRDGATLGSVEQLDHTAEGFAETASEHPSPPVADSSPSGLADLPHPPLSSLASPQLSSFFC
ncbi:unnamed protein product [Linum trigynum]|uniref:Uncharacterized protein n=1 Tax=Linum trigynum TaxID=586398 RepID=A0AAV2CX37_9ROSI